MGPTAAAGVALGFLFTGLGLLLGAILSLEAFGLLVDGACCCPSVVGAGLFQPASPTFDYVYSGTYFEEDV